jgi:hypothetical protein
LLFHRYNGPSEALDQSMYAEKDLIERRSVAHHAHALELDTGV